MAAPQQPGPPPSNPAYFVDTKRGEVNELKAILRNPKIMREQDKRREAIKKVIAYMTLGIDVSRLFSEMVMAASTKDVIQKKMVYLYLCTYAEQKAELAIMAINTLQKDCKDDDPMIRGMSLRSLCSLRVPNIVEWALPSVRLLLADTSPYVRKTAVIGVAKLYRINPAIVKATDSDLVDILYNVLKDKDTAVIANAITALNEILMSEGQMAINTQIIMYLLNRIREFNEWGQCIVLDLVARYAPATNEEMFDIMNVLEDCLKYSNSAVVLGASKVFLNFTKKIPKIHSEVYKRLKEPLLTLMTGPSTELSFVVLAHIQTLVSRAPGVFDDKYKHFFCRFNDPSCVKLQKLQILTDLANEKTLSDVINELSEYVTDVDAEVARQSIRGIGKIAVRVPAAVDDAIEHLLSFLNIGQDYVSAEACICVKDLLRKYPERYEEVIPAMQKTLKTIEETEGKVAVIWMIGEYGDTINDAPYILEPLIDAFDDEPSAAVRMELLTATMKLFFKRPPELKAMLGKLLSRAVADSARIDVRDRGLLYYRLLRFDVHEAARVVNCPKNIVESFVESEDKEQKEKIFAEFNTLTVVYGIPAEKFLAMAKAKEDEEEEVKTQAAAAAAKEAKERKAAADKKAAAAPQVAGAAGAGAGAAAARPGLDASRFEQNVGTYQGISIPGVSTPTAAAGAGAAAILPFDGISSGAAAAAGGPVKAANILPDLFELTGTPAPAPAPAAAAAAKPALELQSGATIDANTFQSQWGAWPACASSELALKNPASASQVEGLLGKAHVLTLASGQVQGFMKFYFYARQAGGDGLFLVEAVADLRTGRLHLTVKSGKPTLGDALLAIIRAALASLL